MRNDASSFTGDGGSRDGASGASAARLASLCSGLSFGRRPRDRDGAAAPASALPRLVYRGPTTHIYRCPRRGEGLKVSSRARVERERRVAPSLPFSCPRRRLRDVARCRDAPAAPSRAPRSSYRFDWVDGVTLGAWLAARGPPAPRGPAAELRARLDVATALAKALGECHAAGVAHGKLEPANVIVEAPQGGGGHPAVSLIDLSAAVVLAGGRDDAGDRAHVRADLAGLGRVFGRLFGGEADAAALLCAPPRGSGAAHDSDEDSCGDASRNKRGKSSRAIEGMPLYLTAMVAALIHSHPQHEHGGEAYESVSQVLGDLRAASRK